MQLTNWSNGREYSCVVMCGGAGTRFATSSSGKHKSMASVKGMPVIGHVIDYWSRMTKDFVFVVKHGKEPLMEYVKTLPISSTFVEPVALRGIADGLTYVRPHVSGPFITVLGDCFCRGQFDLSEPFGYGIGVLPNADPATIKNNYAVPLRQGLVTSVEEKPATVKNSFCGTGFYFFQPDVFDFIQRTRPSERSGELEITDVLATIIASGTPLKAVRLEGHYINVNRPDHLQQISELL